ncbi:2-vinyl bacteriochlorophyllide hydratase [Luminiphilus syltensis]|nr:2-vinyl bacteriochlorophyllide hydratase [Luminiphilus syltensis]
MAHSSKKNAERKMLYTPEQLRRRNETRWTLVQGLLAPLQFLVFAISVVFVINYLVNGTGLFEATVSVVIKTFLLFAIMVTGAIWEKVVFGQYLFAEAFFWEDAVSMIVIALHSAYLLALIFGFLTPTGQMWLALAAYAAYVINAAQFLIKMGAARRAQSDNATMESGLLGVAD